MTRWQSPRSGSWLALIVAMSAIAPGCALQRFFEKKRAAAQERVDEGRKSAGSDVLPQAKAGNPVNAAKEVGRVVESKLPSDAASAVKAVGTLAPTIAAAAAASIGKTDSPTGSPPSVPPEPAESPPSGTPDPAQIAYDEALAHVRNGDDAGALPSFEAARNLKDPRVLRDRGFCERRLHRSKDAFTHLRLYQEATKGQLSPQDEKEIADAVGSERMQIETADALNDAEKADYTMARELFDSRDFVNARRKYSELYRQSGHPRLLFDVGLCDARLGHYAAALPVLERYEQESKGNLKDEKVQELKVALSQARGMVTQVTLVVDPAGASVRIDDGSPESITADQPLLVDRGQHQVHIAKDGYQEYVSIREFTKAPVKIEVKLQVAGRLAIVTRGSGGVISVDGQIRGTAYWDDYVALGKHQVDVAWPDKQSYHRSVIVRADHPTQLFPDPEDGPTRWRTWLLIGVGVALAGAGTAYYFASRSAGSSPPEVGTLSPGTVQLPLKF